ncbi:DUF952 domain-containing protein [Pseudaquidulcibacter saccharophilus]|uniref:DUF952 domain-containing protein n=1 Tax=Pseudaquidulcibacter saccharophilus TaxID=2831900 RepID=UPI001EFF343C|nr:DUF952 domain-containing protein [Pseudaquidulcibacter saccharophilus]
MQSIAYKIERKDIWQQAQQTGTYFGSALDLKDGFIHLSTLDQLNGTLRLYFTGIDNLLIIMVDLAKCGEAIKWETSRGGAQFPHIYAPLEMNQIIECFDADYDGATPIIPQVMLEYLKNGQTKSGAEKNEV